MEPFKHYFDPRKANLLNLQTAVTIGTVKLEYNTRPGQTLTQFWSGTWQWVGNKVVLLEVFLYGNEVEVQLISKDYLNPYMEGSYRDTISWSTEVPEKTLLQIRSYIFPKKPGVQPDIKAATVELEAFLESPKISKDIKITIAKAIPNGFTYFSSVEQAERQRGMI